MFKKNIEALYRFQAKEPLLQKFSVVKQDRKSTVLYDFKDYKWILIPEHINKIKEEDIELYLKLDPTRIMFTNRREFENVKNKDICRRLTEDDRYRFEEFHKACSKHDKQQGMVSLADPVVYGCFEDNRIVSVASLWNWGDELSDIGILTHPSHRAKGYGTSVCQVLMSENDKLFIWRCDVNNRMSFNLATSLGFIEVGQIYCLKKK